MAHGSGREGGVLAWRGSVRAVAAGPSPDAAWALLGDFCSLHRWVPSLSTCRLVEGAAGRPGCVRHCAGPVNMAAAAAADLGRRRRRRGGPGSGSYRATVQVEPDPAGCAVAWSFEADPVQGWTLDGFVGFLHKLARGVAGRLEEEIVGGS
ncbi:hypothetical protein PR202_ga09817 [Eleusine coracana subsp. coracana]|uniref:Lachrymatory-factor synthase n=1 Tax=Eleusine coracana subsp. coracana TaxID=191504 RepID=A0AAV5C4S0_ELECO|nr:hypothetical protein PR202_ga09817 [Eleusine coracana subsp. coracana]